MPILQRGQDKGRNMTHDPKYITRTLPVYTTDLWARKSPRTFQTAMTSQMSYDKWQFSLVYFDDKAVVWSTRETTSITIEKNWLYDKVLWSQENGNGATNLRRVSSICCHDPTRKSRSFISHCWRRKKYAPNDQRHWTTIIVEYVLHIL